MSEHKWKFEVMKASENWRVWVDVRDGKVMKLVESEEERQMSKLDTKESIGTLMLKKEGKLVVERRMCCEEVGK